MTRTLLFSLILSAAPDVGLRAVLQLRIVGRKGATAASGQLQPMEIWGKMQPKPKPRPNSGLLQVLSPSLTHDALFPPLVCPILTLGRGAGKPKKQVSECRAAQGSGAESGHSAGAGMAEPTKLGLVQPWCPWRSCVPAPPRKDTGMILVCSTLGSTALCWSHRHELGDDGCLAPHHGKTHQDKKGPKMKKLEVKRIEGSSSSCTRPGVWQHQWAEEIQGEAPQKREGLAGSQCRRRRSFFPLLANIIMLYINTKCQNVSQLNGSLACTQKEDDKC